MALNINKGKQVGAQKVVIYGSEGIGKSTLAAGFPEPLFIDVEGGTGWLDISRVDKPSNWAQLLNIIDEISTANVCKTVVLDTADWAEQMASEHICLKNRKTGIEDFGYGKGYTYLAEGFGQLLAKFDKCIANGIHVVVIAHAKMRKFEQPDEMGAYDRWEMKLSKQVAPMLKEWADLLLFCNYQTTVITTDSGSKKATGGKRVMYTTHTPIWDAKNRCGLPDCVPLEFDSIKDAIVFKTPIERLHELMERDGVGHKELIELIAAKGHYPEADAISAYPDSFISGWIIKYWNNIKETLGK